MAQRSREVRCLWWGESAEDDITKLPSEWEVRVADDNRVYFVNHDCHTTQWQHPINEYRYQVTPGLPYGWQKYKDDDDTKVFVDHFGQVRTFVDPRLITKVVNEFPRRYGIRGYRSIRNSFNSLVKADLVLKDVDLSNTVAVVTGGNSGLGYQTSLSLCKRGARVILACRDAIRANQAITNIKQAYADANVEFMLLDLSSLPSIKEFADLYISWGLPLDILVCNAGVFGGSLRNTVHGLEHHFAVNHLGHFYLTSLLIPVLKRSKPARVVVISSESHWYPSDNSSKLDLQFLQNPTPNNKYKVITAYGASKLCNLLFALEFNRRYVEDGIYCNAVHPGNLLPTNLVRNAGMMYRTAFTLAKLFTKSLEQAAATIVYCAAHPSMKEIGGLYMCDCWPAEPSSEAQDPITAKSLWELSEHTIRQNMNISNGESC